jgi:hypothetical protein
MTTDFLRMVEDFQRRDVILEAEVKYLEKMQQEAVVQIINPPSKKTYTLICDEGEHMGGDDVAPPPLAFFLAGILF